MIILWRLRDALVAMKFVNALWLLLIVSVTRGEVEPGKENLDLFKVKSGGLINVVVF